VTLRPAGKADPGYFRRRNSANAAGDDQAAPRFDALYEQGNRNDLGEQERGEIAVIESFLSRQLDQNEIEAAATSVIAEMGGMGIKDMNRVMVALRERFSGAIDLSRAAAVVKRLLG